MKIFKIKNLSILNNINVLSHFGGNYAKVILKTGLSYYGRIVRIEDLFLNAIAILSDNKKIPYIWNFNCIEKINILYDSRLFDKKKKYDILNLIIVVAGDGVEPHRIYPKKAL